MARRVNDLQTVPGAVCACAQRQNFTVMGWSVRDKRAPGTRCRRRRKSQYFRHGHIFQGPGCTEDVRAQRLQRLGAGRMVRVRVGTHDHANVAAPPIRILGAVKQPLQVAGIVGARIDGDETGVGFPYQIAVGARAGHDAWVGRCQAQQIFENRHSSVGTPVGRRGDGMRCVEHLGRSNHGAHFAAKERRGQVASR